MSRLRRTPRWELLIYGPALAFYAVFVARTSFVYEGRRMFWLFDDAMISMRYARNLAEGHGLVWNGGEKVEGYSNFLWTLLMSGVHALGFSDTGAPLAMMVIGALILLATTFVVGRICRAVAPGRELARGVAMALTAGFYPLIYWTLGGLEVGLAALLIATGVLPALRLEAAWSARTVGALALVLAAAALTRDDLLLPVAIIVLYAAWRVPAPARRRTIAVLVAVVGLAVAGHLAFRLAYYGDALPNTYYLKLDRIGVLTRVKRGATVVAYTWLQELYAPLLLAGALLFVRRVRVSPAIALLLVLFLAQCAYCVYVGGDAFEAARFSNRYIATAVPLLLVVAGLGVEQVVTAGRAQRRLPLALGAAILVVALLQLKDWLPTHLFQAPESDGLNVLRPLAAVCCAGVLMGASLMRERRAWLVPVSAVAVALALLFSMNARSLRIWLEPEAPDVAIGRTLVRQGVDIGALTPPGTTVAMSAAGNVAYFDHRPAIDLLGKMDPVIAKGPPKPGDFRPGHDKWNYPHSIGQLRPDLLAQIWEPTPADLCALRRWGYREVAPQVYVHGNALGADEAEFARREKAVAVVKPLPTPAACAR